MNLLRRLPCSREEEVFISNIAFFLVFSIFLFPSPLVKIPQKNVYILAYGSCRFVL